MRRMVIASAALAVLVACSDDSGSGTASSASTALVIESRQVEGMPGVIPCAVPEGLGEDHPGQPLRSGYAAAAFYETPAEALWAFVALNPPDGSSLGLADSGYVEMRFPEATLYTEENYLIFGRDSGEGWVTLIGVYHTPDGWTVTWWAGSGC